MGTLVGMVGATIGGYAGWYLGKPGGLYLAFVLSIVGTALGGYWGKRWVSENF